MFNAMMIWMTAYRNYVFAFAAFVIWVLIPTIYFSRFFRRYVADRRAHSWQVDMSTGKARREGRAKTRG